jgi:hypothetical protein
LESVQDSYAPEEGYLGGYQRATTDSDNLRFSNVPGSMVQNEYGLVEDMKDGFQELL